MVNSLKNTPLCHWAYICTHTPPVTHTPPSMQSTGESHSIFWICTIIACKHMNMWICLDNITLYSHIWICYNVTFCYLRVVRKKYAPYHIHILQFLNVYPNQHIHISEYENHSQVDTFSLLNMLSHSDIHMFEYDTHSVSWMLALTKYPKNTHSVSWILNVKAVFKAVQWGQILPYACPIELNPLFSEAIW